MDNPLTLPTQLLLEFDLGLQLMNAVAIHGVRRRRAMRQARAIAGIHAGSARSVTALGEAALFRHCQALLRTEPLEVFRHHDGTTRLRVCQAFEYVIDRTRGRIYAHGFDDGVHLISDRHAPVPPVQVADLELLAPLQTPFWLRFVAYLPGGICGHPGVNDVFQLVLGKNQPDVVQVLEAICKRVYRRLRATREFLRLQGLLSYWLIRLVGTYDVHLALHARIRMHGCVNALDVCQVWAHRPLYVRMARENPKLLPVLTAWLEQAKLPPDHRLEDAVPAMRTDMLASGLPRRAWRYLVEYGSHVLARESRTLTWIALLGWLRLMQQAHWPAPPPHRFLGLLKDTAGRPDSYMEPGWRGMPGWFWNWTCTYARDCAHDPQAYARLQHDVVRWAQLVREHEPRPDGNQRRRRLQWLRRWAQEQEATAQASARPGWSLWLRDVLWQRVERVHVVPLLSERALHEEAVAMHNCAEDYASACRRGEYLLLSLRNLASGQRIALMGLVRQGMDDTWGLEQLAGPCNRAVPRWVWPVARSIAEMVQRADEARKKGPPGASQPRQRVLCLTPLLQPWLEEA